MFKQSRFGVDEQTQPAPKKKRVDSRQSRPTTGYNSGRSHYSRNKRKYQQTVPQLDESKSQKRESIAEIRKRLELDRAKKKRKVNVSTEVNNASNIKSLDSDATKSSKVIKMTNISTMSSTAQASPSIMLQLAGLKNSTKSSVMKEKDSLLALKGMDRHQKLHKRTFHADATDAVHDTDDHDQDNDNFYENEFDAHVGDDNDDDTHDDVDGGSNGEDDLGDVDNIINGNDGDSMDLDDDVNASIVDDDNSITTSAKNDSGPFVVPSAAQFDLPLNRINPPLNSLLIQALETPSSIVGSSLSSTSSTSALPVISNLFPMQAAIVPAILQCYGHKDVCVSAPTGSGKTLCYLLPIFQRLLGHNNTTPLFKHVRGLVVTPTRDLAVQIHHLSQLLCQKIYDCSKQSKDRDQAVQLTVGLSIGQSSFIQEQRALNAIVKENNLILNEDYYTFFDDFAMRNMRDRLEKVYREDDIYAGKYTKPTSTSLVDLLICTPGRLVDHINSNADNRRTANADIAIETNSINALATGFSLRHVRIFVLDEADRLISQHFQDWISIVLLALRRPSQVIEESMPAVSSFATKVKASPFNGPLQYTHIQRPYQHKHLDRYLDIPLQKLLFSATLSYHNHGHTIPLLQLQHPLFFQTDNVTGNQTTRAVAGAQNTQASEDHDGDDMDDSVGKSKEKKAKQFQLPPTLKEFIVTGSAGEKPLLLIHLLLHYVAMDMQVIVFSGKVESAHRLCRLLQCWNETSTSVINNKETNDVDNDKSDDDDESDNKDVSDDNGDKEDAKHASGDVESLKGTSSTRTVLSTCEYSSALSQKKRSKILQSFRSKRINVMVGSDVIARGIDLDCIDVVINYDVPNYAQTYVHRVGRTARAGKAGIALTLCHTNQVHHLRHILRYIDNSKLKTYPIETSTIHSYIEQYKQTLALLKKVLQMETRGILDPGRIVTSTWLESHDLNEDNTE